MIVPNQISWMAMTGVKIEQADIIWTPHTIQWVIEKEFNIPGLLFFRSRSPKYSFPRFLFSYILHQRMMISPDIIHIIYGIKHDLTWHGCNVITNTLETKSPKYNYIRCTKILQRIKKWDISEILLQLESIPAPTASHAAQRRNILEQSIAVAQYTRQLSAPDATEPVELRLL